MANANVTKMIAFDSLYLEGNVRTEACERIPEMVASLRRNGFKSNHPLVVSERADGRYLVLCGNRRVKGLAWLQENDNAEFIRVLLSSKVPCIVHRGLTEEEEILLRIDHSADEDRIPLDQWSEFQAIRQLVRCFTGESQEAIAEKLGIRHAKGKNAGQPNRSYVQTRVNLARLPSFVQDEYRKLLVEGKDATLVRITDIKELYAAYNAEFSAYPDGNGPEFNKVWQGILNPAPAEAQETQTGTARTEPAALKPETARMKAQGAASRTVKRILLAITNQGGSLAELDAAAIALETDAAILADIRAYLGADEYSVLVSSARAARVEQEAPILA